MRRSKSKWVGFCRTKKRFCGYLIISSRFRNSVRTCFWNISKNKQSIWNSIRKFSIKKCSKSSRFSRSTLIICSAMRIPSSTSVNSLKLKRKSRNTSSNLRLNTSLFRAFLSLLCRDYQDTGYFSQNLSTKHP